MSSRTQFESWILVRLGDGFNWTMTVTEQMKADRETAGLHCNNVGNYVAPAVQLAWEAWQQSQQTANNPPADSQRPTTHAQGHAR